MNKREGGGVKLRENESEGWRNVEHKICTYREDPMTSSNGPGKIKI